MHTHTHIMPGDDVTGEFGKLIFAGDMRISRAARWRLRYRVRHSDTELEIVFKFTYQRVPRRDMNYEINNPFLVDKRNASSLLSASLVSLTRLYIFSSEILRNGGRGREISSVL